MTSVVIFATLGPPVLALLVMLFVGRKVESGGRLGAASLLWRTVVAGALVPVGVAISSIPSSIFGGKHPNTVAESVVFVLELAVFAVVAVPALIKAWRHGENPARIEPVRPDLRAYLLDRAWKPLAHGTSRYFSAKGGVTSDGTPTGNVFYAALCLAMATLWVTLASTAKAPRSASDAPRPDSRQPA